MRRVIVKEGPLVFLRNVVVMEIVALVFFYAISFLADYQILYQSVGLAKYLRYDIFLMLAFSVFQFAYISLLFLDWYFALFEINEKEIVRKTGLLFRHRRAMSLTDVDSVEVYESPLSRAMKHGTIIIHHSSGATTKIRNVLSAEENAHVVKQMARLGSGSRRRGIAHFLEDGENRYVEFKETLRLNTKTGLPSRDMERAALKTIVAFLNADGGTLLIGVTDAGSVTGLERDYETLPKKNRDGFENHLNQLVKTAIGVQFTKYVGITFEWHDKKDVCIVSVSPSHRPAYLHENDRKEDFFVRLGNSTHPFSMSEAEEYIKTHWK